MARSLPLILVLLGTMASTAACGGGSGFERVLSGGYRTAFPSTDTSGQLTRLFQAVKQTQVIVTYDVYYFSEENAPTRLDFQREDVVQRAVLTTSISDARGATAIAVSRSNRGVVLLATSHAVVRPDTVVDYFGSPAGADRDPARRIRSLSIKNSQVNWVIDLPGARAFDVLASDEQEDLALIGFPLLAVDDLDDLRSIPIRAGNPADLAPGSFVYILGYPASFRMVSRGIATPLDDGQGSFVTDGNWNQGVSGGAIVALRGGSERLEWVGMARAASAQREQRLMPSEVDLEEYDPAVPYDGPIFVEEVLRIQYGVTLSVPMTTIRTFIARSAPQLREAGYPVPRL
ncbi:hypothetical protein BH23GEM11_BH23GEM11_04940 [soil metagenome]